MRTRKPYRTVLHRTHGYTAQASRLGAARRTPRSAQRAWSLAQTIAARYTAIERRWPAMALVFEQPDRTGLSLTNSYQTTHSSLFMNPRVLLRRLLPHRAEKPNVVADRTLAQPLGVNAIPMTMAASSRPQANSQEQDNVIARIVRRTVREEFPLMANAGPVGRISGQAGQVEQEEPGVSRRLPSLTRVYRRTAIARGEVSAVAATARIERKVSSAVAERDRGVAATSQLPVDITGITDQVLQVLDRRIVAQRERMGSN
jgi:hypothetical protein